MGEIAAAGGVGSESRRARGRVELLHFWKGAPAMVFKVHPLLQSCLSFHCKKTVKNRRQIIV
jgi:hypothetical protein